ncbi:MAG: putative type pilus assembly FimV-related transrane protein [Myxococcaceae bacterium]|nr:putative type pilus assembly FimV-related transrane protein [Myxococcaceae bacterium]
MVAIPPSKDTDAEDVAWGLQTAEALWKRGERIDAIVWLRRAAQAAGEAADDDRALELARSAAELSDWMATQPAGGTLPPTALTNKPPAGYDPHAVSTFVPFGDEERTGQSPAIPNNAPTYIPQAPTYVPRGGAPSNAPDAAPVSIPVDVEGAEAAGGELPVMTAPRLPRPAPPTGHAPSSPTMQTAEPYFPPPDGAAGAAAAAAAPASHGLDAVVPMPTPLAPPVAALDEPGHDEPGHDDDQGRDESTSVPPAEHVHAGMFNPWDDGALPAPTAVALPPPAAHFAEEEEEVITSVRPGQLAQQRADALAAAIAHGQSPLPSPLSPPSAPPSDTTSPGSDAPAAPVPPSAPAPAKPAPVKPSPPRPPPLPPRARKPAPPAPSAPAVKSAPPARMTPPPPSPTQVMAQPEAAVDAAPPSERTDPNGMTVEGIEAQIAASAPVPAAPAAPAAPADVPQKLDLDSVEAFADLPDDARAAFAAAAEVSVLAEGEEVSSFALAYILSGTVDVAATMVDAPAAQLSAGAVLRSRGTTDEGVPMRLIGVSSGVVATWTDAEVTEAFRTCPWVEEDLRVAADRLQTLVGVTIGPLGERLDASIREQIIGRLTMRTLSAGEVVVTAGEQMPGLLLVGVGELELVDGDRVAGTVGSGEFVFPTEVLGGGDAPHTARAGPGGALILFGDRRIAQELLVTCPPLLEVFAGM